MEQKTHDYILFHYDKVMLAPCVRSVVTVLSGKEYLKLLTKMLLCIHTNIHCLIISCIILYVGNIHTLSQHFT